jgi:molybdenum cofactor cytidylyltransferase
MFMKAVNAAVASDAKPVFVVTGYRNDEMEQYLEKLDVNVLYNPAFASGIRTSINLGLRSVPSSCDGAILLPADMPYITETEINKLINKFDKTKEKQVCVLSNKGVKSNPVLWSKALYHKADIVPENAGMRAVFVEHADYTKQIEVKDKKKLVDVNLPSDVREFADN